MANKVRLLYFDAHDDNNILLPGLTLVAYPRDTLVNGTTATEPGGVGQYLFTFDNVVAGNDLIISQFYDIRDETGAPAMVMTDVPIGVSWEWIIDIVVAATPQNVTFNGLNDAIQAACPLPTTIPNAIVEIMYTTQDRHFHITAVNNLGFTIAASAAGLPLPVTVRCKVKAGEV